VFDRLSKRDCEIEVRDVNDYMMRYVAQSADEESEPIGNSLRSFFKSSSRILKKFQRRGSNFGVEVIFSRFNTLKIILVHIIEHRNLF